ncbi:MAG TPA: YdeI/OmpD-associated family protein [Bacteroidales bacterium]|nr:YdeI/OmpD-associated family protein [Bacteroidales bacterium]
MYQFEAQLKKGINSQGWTYVDIPSSVSNKLKKKGRIKVCGTIGQENFRTSILPKGDGTHYLFVSQPLLKKIGKMAGDDVQVKFEEDTKPRTVDVSEDMMDAISLSPKALATFIKFSYSHKKELTEWINDAKKAETRERRIVKLVLMLENYRKPGK